ncbi:hypothetical protein [Microbacterium mangrovi]|nr:hypothetical protein [Microbacterium mangrovi]
MMKIREPLIVLGWVLITLAVVGSIASISVMRAGGFAGGVNLAVNVLATVGGAIVLIGQRRRAVKRAARENRPD